jgi:type IV pilus assembly protein PilV
LNSILDSGFTMKKFSSLSSIAQDGFSLLEVLIAVLIFSIGLMGLAGLQVVAMKANQNALFRSIASEAAYDLLDRLRANTRAASAGALPQNIKDDIAAWNTGLGTVLPGGKGYVCRQAVKRGTTDCLGNASLAPGVMSGGANGDPAKLFFLVKVVWEQAATGDEGFVNLSLTDDEIKKLQQVIVVGQL